MKSKEYRPHILLLFLLSIVLSWSNATAQTTTDGGYSQLLKNDVPISPQAAATERYGNYPVDYSTGVPEISIPIFDVRVGEYTLPVTLVYHASGIKVQEIASPVGLGWTINAGGIVSRQLKGTTDVVSDGKLQLTYSSEHEIDSVMNAGRWSNYYWHRLAHAGQGDTESDRYTYSLNGNGGVFRYCTTDNAMHTIPHSDVRIENLSSGGFLITDTDGTKYYFGQPEENSDNLAGTLTAVTTWYVTRIEAVSSQNVIEFEYVRGATPCATYVYQMNNRGDTYELKDDTPGPQLEENLYGQDTYQTYGANNHYTVLLKTIKWAGNTITFTYAQDRQECFGKLDRLTDITVKNCNGTTVRRVVPDNDHYSGSGTYDKRMMLQGLTVKGATDDGAQSYGFAYNSTPLPNYVVVGHDIRCHEDYWGYYNGKSCDSWIPSSIYDGRAVSNNRTPSENDMKACTLESITHPTGGRTEFKMEANMIYDGRVWGGLRLQRMTNTDASGNTLSTRFYTYARGCPAHDITDENSSYSVEYVYGYRDTHGLQYQTGEHIITPSSTVLPLTGIWGYPVMYGLVTEMTNNAGKIEYEYDELLPGLNNMQDNGHEYEPLRLYSEDYNFDRGNIRPVLKCRSIYAYGSYVYTLKAQEVYNYEEVQVDPFRVGVRFEESNVLINYGGIEDPYDPAYDTTPFSHTFSYSDVWAIPSFYRLKSKTVSDYNNDVAVVTTYDYDADMRTMSPVAESTLTSEGDTLRMEYTYPQTSSDTTYKELEADNMHVPVETVNKNGDCVIERTQSLYSTVNGKQRLTSLSVGKGSETPERRALYEYDSLGNPTYIVRNDADMTVLLWGYNGMHPVAKIEGMTRDAVTAALGAGTVSKLLQLPTDANIYAINDNVRLSAMSLATTYTWKPLVGVTSVRNPNLATTYYAYDNMGRLSSVKDNDSIVVESYTYNCGLSNYVTTRLMKDASASNYIQTTDYYDGIGRKVETVGYGQSPEQLDLVTLYEYDYLDRQTIRYLPTPFAKSGNLVKSSVFREAAYKFYQDEPYEEIKYDDTPTDRVAHLYAPGTTYEKIKVGVSYERTGNGTDEYTDSCIVYRVSADGKTLSSDGIYARNTLFTEKTTDENGNVSYVFRDKEGRTVLERSILGSSRLDTRYVYDMYGNTAFVLPPSASDVLVSGSWNIDTDATLRNFAYHYRYDSRNRCVVRKLPGCDEVLMKYDKADRLIFTQDGNQRGNQWTYFLYDKYGRRVVAGTTAGNSVPDLSAEIATATFTGKGIYGGYTSTLAVADSVPLQVEYYDNYTFLGTLGLSSILNYKTDKGGDNAFPGNSAPNARGMKTGERISQLCAPSLFTITANYYDMRGRQVQCLSTNHLGGVDTDVCNYNFVGTKSAERHYHTAESKEPVEESYTYTYDHSNRLLSTHYKLNGDTLVQLAVNSYDSIGRPASCNVMNRETVSYSYNIRNWITAISSPNFREDIAYYADPYSLPVDSSYYNGNIAAIRWKCGNDTLHRGYNYIYDAVDRLTTANYNENGIACSKYSVAYGYDKMGNILSLNRNGISDSGTFGTIDNMACSYAGNRLISIAGSSAVEYTYDANGNMTSDMNLGITSVTYNVMNLPSCITFANGNTVNYVYDALGRKLSVSHYSATDSQTHTYDYCGNKIYEDGVLSQIMVDDGYVAMNGDAGEYFYYLHDHNGSNRLVVGMDSGICQVNHYYPYGGLFAESTNADFQRFKFVGKELDRENGLNWYDHGARFSDAAIGRWHTMDPLAEKYYSQSPYSYCAGNPVSNVDINGRSIIPKIAKATWKIGKKVLKNGISALSKADTYYSAVEDIVDNTETLFDSEASTFDRIIAGVSLASELLPISADDLKDGTKLISGIVHGNSKASTKAQHVYVIKDKNTDETVKVGISGGKITKKGKSYRAQRQVSKWNREKGGNVYESKIILNIPEGKNSRDKALEAERDKADKLRKEGQLKEKDKHQRP
jgi:RHS repeat-associated protein